MLTANEIKKASREASIDFHEYENHYFIIAFEKGIKFAQTKLLEKASIGFAEWAPESPMPRLYKDCWQAARLFSIAEHDKRCDEIRNEMSEIRINAITENDKLKNTIKDAYELIRHVSYSEENGRRYFCGNEYPWLVRGVSILEKAIKEFDNANTK